MANSKNSIKIGEESYELKPVKMKYIKDGFYSKYRILKDKGFVELVSKFTDGTEITEGFLKAVFDKEEIPVDMIDNLDVDIIKDLIEKAAKMNEIVDEEKNV